MARCSYCQRKFRSEQAVKAHLRHCVRYKTALGKLPQAATPRASSAQVQSVPLVASSDFIDPCRDFTKSMCTPSTTQPLTPQQQRRRILQAVKAKVIDAYWTAEGQITPAMRGDAKSAIERELGTLPLEELPFEEVVELAIGIRDRLYGPSLKQQVQEQERHRDQQAEQRRKEREALSALMRAARRKDLLMSQAKSQALRYCEENNIIGLARLTMLCDIKSRLGDCLTGEETIPEGKMIVQVVLETHFAESDARLTSARAKAAEKWREEMVALAMLGSTVILPVLAAMYPTQAAEVCAWLERISGWFAEASHPSAEPKDASASPPPKRRRRVKVPSPGVFAMGHSVADTAQAEGLSERAGVASSKT